MKSILPKLANNHISVDCVVLGFDGELIKVLLLHRHGEHNGKEFHDMKLPGSLIYEDENLDEAAKRVLHELTGLKNMHLMQFKSFGSKDRTSDPRDVIWLERAQEALVHRIVTVGYLALVKIDRAISRQFKDNNAEWVPVNELPSLAFDHNIIIKEAMRHVRTLSEMKPDKIYNLLPRKFTASQLRTLLEVISGKEFDARNFHKKIAQMPYVVPLEEFETGVAHRAARFYKFDRKIYNKTRK